MTFSELKELANLSVENIKNHGIFPKENQTFDYKKSLKVGTYSDPTEIFMRNFAKDIIAFANSNGGIIFLGIAEDSENGKYEDIGLDSINLGLLERIDLNTITQKFEKITKVGIGIDLQHFQSGTRKFYYIIIEKQNQVLIPIIDYLDYNIKKGDIVYRGSSKNELANLSTQDFNRFLQIKANEKNREFMEIWSKLMPEIFDINPREILLINPKYNRIYGFNGKDNILSSSDIEIDHSEKGVFNIILNAISAGEIGKISDTEGKPLYKIVGEITSEKTRDYITITTLHTESKKLANFRFSSIQLKQVMKYLGWVYDEYFKVENPAENTLNIEFSKFIWVESFDKIKNTTKVVCSEEAIEEILTIVNNQDLHQTVFGRILVKK